MTLHIEPQYKREIRYALVKLSNYLNSQFPGKLTMYDYEYPGTEGFFKRWLYTRLGWVSEGFVIQIVHEVTGNLPSQRSREILLAYSLPAGKGKEVKVYVAQKYFKDGNSMYETVLRSLRELQDDMAYEFAVSKDEDSPHLRRVGSAA